MKNVSEVWTVVYKEKGDNPLAYTYTSKKEAVSAKLMIEKSDGGELIDDDGNFAGYMDIEWCYLINGKVIEGEC